MKTVGYCGNIASVAEEIYFSKDFNLKVVFVEDSKLESKMLTFCTIREIKIIPIKNKVDLEQTIKNNYKLDCLIICGFGIILSKSLLDFVPAYNFHPGRLPDYKGRHPTFFSTINGEDKIQITLHVVSSGIDEGDIIDIHSEYYRFDENESHILMKIQNAVKKLLPVLNEFIEGKILSKKNKGGKYYPAVSNSDKIFTSQDKPSLILNIIRAQFPYNGAIFSHLDKNYWVKDAIVERIDIEKYKEVKNVLFDYENRIMGIRIDDLRWIKFLNIKNKLDE